MIPAPQRHSKALGPGVCGPELLVPTSAVLERPPAPKPQQPTAGGHTFMVDPHALIAADNASADPTRQHTKYPYVTGTSVLAIKYKDGVLIAADTLGAYGSTKRYKSTPRVVKVIMHAHARSPMCMSTSAPMHASSCNPHPLPGQRQHSDGRGR
jgi:20S proteasome subunit beta 7